MVRGSPGGHAKKGSKKGYLCPSCKRPVGIWLQSRRTYRHKCLTGIRSVDMPQGPWSRVVEVLA